MPSPVVKIAVVGPLAVRNVPFGSSRKETRLSFRVAKVRSSISRRKLEKRSQKITFQPFPFGTHVEQEAEFIFSFRLQNYRIRNSLDEQRSISNVERADFRLQRRHEVMGDERFFHLRRTFVQIRTHVASSQLQVERHDLRLQR